MDSNEIKKANRKAMPKFILMMIISLIVGGAMGLFFAEYGLNSLSGHLKTAGEIFGMYIAPWLMLALAIILPVGFILLYKRVKKLFSKWDGEDEEVSDAVDEKLSIIIWVTSAASIISYFLIAASYSTGFTAFENEEKILPVFIGIVAFFGILIETVIIQQKCVDATKKTNPEKTASIYDTKFQEKWMDSCDEAEKIMIGKCAYKAYSTTNTVCSILAIVLAVGALFFEIGFLPSLVVCIIWIVNQSVYCKEAIKYSKAGNKIR